MDPLDPELRHWISQQLAALGRPSDFDVEPLKVEASHRRFYRVRPRETAEPTQVVMSSPPDLEHNEQFELLASIFSKFGVGVPRIMASDRAAGWYLMTDLGSVHLEDVYGSPQADAAMDLALDTLLRIQAVNDLNLQPYTPGRFRDELDIFRRWFVEDWLQVPFPAGDLTPVFEALVAMTQDQPQCCVHRDFHCRNLLVGEHTLGVVDFQDALLGPVSYDLASLLRDCYHRFSETEIERWREGYLARTSLQLDPVKFAADLDLMAVQRQLKAVGIFARLQLRDVKSSHLRYIPPVLAHLGEVAERYPILQPLSRRLPSWQQAAAAKLAASQ
jgi:aminoglycoside/choline kinase family phosphotransferase